MTILSIDANVAGTEASDALEKRLAEQPDDPVVLVRLATIYQRNGNTDKAIEAYEKILKTNPQNVGVMTNLAQLYTPKNIPRALELAKSAYQLSPNDPTVSLTLGRLVYQTGDYQWAYSLLQQAVQSQPRDPNTLYDLACAAYAVGRVLDAVADMQSALQTNPAFPRAAEAKRFLDMIALVTNPTQASAAIDRVETVLKLDSDYVPALMVLASIDEQKNDLDAAKQTYEKVLGRYPDFSPAQKQLAILYAEDASNDQKAYALAMKAQQSFPDDPQLAKALGIIVYRQGDYARAETLLKGSAAQRTTDGELMYYLGMAQYHLNDRVESKASLLRSLTLNLPDKLAEDAKRVLAGLK